ncbi:MAG: amidohydrolase family protein [Daejeonella sp.]
MTKYFSANYIFPVSGEPIRNGVVSVKRSGEVIKIFDENESKYLPVGKVENYEGFIVPGFVNTHCHLELSHLHQKFAKHEGLVSFIKSIITQRGTNDEEILAAMKKADKAMAENGIVAVGDIVNNNLSKTVKEESSIYYHNFVELLGFDPAQAEERFKKGLELKDNFSPLSTSLSPHAPYSVSRKLFSMIRSYYKTHKGLLTMHNQESEEENNFFRYRTGAFIDFYKFLNLDISFLKLNPSTSIQRTLPALPKKQKILLVHNIYTNVKDIHFVNRFNRYVNWCFCPNANLYIENKLPEIPLFLMHNLNITLGTDSLASNDELCILSELKTIYKYFPDIPLTKTIQWATLNGAKFLGIDHTFGSLEFGKTPGLNLITETKGMNLTEKSKVKKLI